MNCLCGSKIHKELKLFMQYLKLWETKCFQKKFDFNVFKFQRISFGK
jgi:hypothetical protein